MSITCPAGAKLLDVPFEEIDKKLTVKEHNKAIARDLQLVITAILDFGRWRSLTCSKITSEARGMKETYLPSTLLQPPPRCLSSFWRCL